MPKVCTSGAAWGAPLCHDIQHNGIHVTTLSIMTLSITTLSIMKFSLTLRQYDIQHNDTTCVCRMSYCCVSFILSVKIKSISLNVVMLSVVMLNVVAPLVLPSNVKPGLKASQWQLPENTNQKISIILKGVFHLVLALVLARNWCLILLSYYVSSITNLCLFFL
jgi:hypothetical protein